MWQRFTQRARRAILLAQNEAGQRQSLDVCTHHLLLGILRDEGCVAVHVLAQMGLSAATLRDQIRATAPPIAMPVRAQTAKPTSWLGRHFGAKPASVPAPAPAPAQTSGEPKLTAQAKRVLELADDEARRLKHDYIGTEHLLLGLIRQDTATAALVLFKSGITLNKARAQLIEFLGSDNARGAAIENSAQPSDVPDAGALVHFTQSARSVIALAQQEAHAHEGDHVGTGHLLLGLLREERGIAAQVLRQMDVSLESLRAQVQAESANGAPAKSTPLTPKAKIVLRLATEESERRNQNTIGTEHLLWAIACVPNSLAATLLVCCGHSPKAIDEKIKSYIAENPAKQEQL